MEVQRVVGDDLGGDFLEGTLVRQKGDPLARGEPTVRAAPRAHLQVRLIFRLGRVRPALLADVPERLGRDAQGRLGRRCKPSHSRKLLPKVFLRVVYHIPPNLSQTNRARENRTRFGPQRHKRCAGGRTLHRSGCALPAASTTCATISFCPKRLSSGQDIGAWKVCAIGSGATGGAHSLPRLIGVFMARSVVPRTQLPRPGTRRVPM